MAMTYDSKSVLHREPTKLVGFVVYRSTCGFNNFEPRPYLRNALYPWSPFDPRNPWALQANGKLRHDLLDQSRAHQLLLHIFSAASLKGLRDQLPHPPGQKLSIKSIKLGRAPSFFWSKILGGTIPNGLL